jgi:hypothetical protein
MNGNLTKGLYDNSVEYMNDTDKASVSAGNYPIILAQGGGFTKKHITESEFINYNNWDAIISTRDEQWGIHGYAVPIVQECNENGVIETGIESAPRPVIEDAISE